MKFLLLSLVILFMSNQALSQLELPELSPQSKLIEHVGYTKIEISYGRPFARGRKIMDGLVRYKRLWRTGAGAGTTISFDNAVVIAGKQVPAGIYAMVTIPDAHEWIVLLNSDTSKLYGDPSEYDVTTEALRFVVKPSRSARYYEALTITLDVKNYNAQLYLNWENTEINFFIDTGSDERALRQIEDTLRKHPTNVEALSQAAYYYFMNNKDLNKALDWLNQALAIGEDRWLFRQKVDVLERMKNNKEVVKTSQQAIAFLSRTKPEGWEHDVELYQAIIHRLQ